MTSLGIWMSLDSTERRKEMKRYFNGSKWWNLVLGEEMFWRGLREKNGKKYESSLWKSNFLKTEKVNVFFLKSNFLENREKINVFFKIWNIKLNTKIV